MFELPFEVFGSRFRNLLTATANKIDREWPYPPHATHRYSKTMLLSLVLAATNTYDALLYLCADKPSDPSRKPEFALAITPLSRVILEALFTVVFVFEDLEQRVAWYHKAGWREIKEEVGRAKQRHGIDERWTGYIDGLERVLTNLKLELQITPEEEADPAKHIKRWPIPSGMKKSASLSDDRRMFLQYLEDWFYRSLSQDVHLSFRGLARHSRYLLLQLIREHEPTEMRQHKSDVLGTTIVLLLALMSEIERQFALGLRTELKFVWGVINPVFTQGQEIYELRYASALGTP